MPRKSKKICTIAQAATLDFRSCEDEVGGFSLPSNEIWLAEHLPWLHIAARICHMNKPQLVFSLKKMPDAPCKELLNRIPETRAFFKAVFDVVQAAEARLLVAGASVAQENRKQRRRAA